jgi:NAD(P)H dehydrogenase (quinone)
MAFATVLTIGPGAPIEPLARALAEEADAFGADVGVHHLDTVGDTIPALLLEDLAQSVGVAIGSSLAPGETEAQMKILNRAARPAIDGTPITFRVATSFTSLAKDDPNAGDAVDRMNRLLYRWGAVIVSPSYADGPAVHWLDNRPGVGLRTGSATSPDSASLQAAARQGRRLATLTGMIGAEISRLERLQL